jgi:NADH:ubiquinone oxidoreductase subunit D
MKNVKGIKDGEEKVIATRELSLSMGPQHPATHGVLKLALNLDGETVTKCTPYIGYLHRGVEKLSENRNYLQIIPLRPPGLHCLHVKQYRLLCCR